MQYAFDMYLIYISWHGVKSSPAVSKTKICHSEPCKPGLNVTGELTGRNATIQVKIYFFLKAIIKKGCSNHVISLIQYS